MQSGTVLVILTLLGLGVACAAGGGDGRPRTSSSVPVDPEAVLRDAMVASQIESRGIRDPSVLAAMRKVPRHLFVPPPERSQAYSDGPLPIGLGQTISQPYIVALMTELIRPDRSLKVLEVGTGSGYQAAVLAECTKEVYTIEIVPQLGLRAEELLRKLGYQNVHVRIGDGYDGWPEQARFHAILVTAAPDDIPKPLLAQLEVGGRLVIPVGVGSQDLVRVTRTSEENYRRETITPVRFVPMTGKAQDRD
jgi:protein-L-isoaspartate(D-aspartate) O-methyltransferase